MSDDDAAGHPARPAATAGRAPTHPDLAAPPPPGIPHAPCPPHVLAAIHGHSVDPVAKTAAYEKSLNR